LVIVKNWVGHLLRGDSLQKEIIEGRLEGKRCRGRPRQKLLEEGCRELKRHGTTAGKMETLDVWSLWTCHLADNLKKKKIMPKPIFV